MPRIYVASLADYNAGNLHGVWIDLDGKSEDEVQEEIATMLRASKHPNALVDCPKCDGSGQPCGTRVFSPCGGTGKVPSAEEFAIHDHEMFRGIAINEHSSISEVMMITECLANASDEDAFAAFYNNDTNAHNNARDWIVGFDDAYRGTFRSIEEYAEDMIEQTTDMSGIPDIIKNHIDYASIARDMECGGDIWTADGGSGIYVFDNM